MNLEIPAELNPFVQQMIASGSFRNESEMVIEGLRLLKSREQLRADVNAGIDQLEAGEGLDGEEVFARLRERACRIAGQQAAKMASLVISPLADRDLNEILDFISRDKPQAAIRWVDRILEKCRLIAENPELGERRPEFKTGEFRSSLVGKYVIFYRPLGDGIEIARVVRGERDLRNL